MDYTYANSVCEVEPRVCSGNEEKKIATDRYRKGNFHARHVSVFRWRYSKKRMYRNQMKCKAAKEAEKEASPSISATRIEYSASSTWNVLDLEVRNPEACSNSESIENELLEERSHQPCTSRESTFVPLQIESPRPSTSKGIVQNEDIGEERTLQYHLAEYDETASEGEETYHEQDALWQIIRNEQAIINNEVLEEDTVPKDAEEANQNGTRCIVNDDYYFKQIQELNKHNPMISCNIDHMDIIRKRREGLKTIWTYKCRMCNYKKDIFSEPEESTGMDINKSAVAATIITGGSYAQPQENLSACDIKCMSSRQYRKYHDGVGEDILELSEKSKNEAAEEERQLALARGDVIRCPLTKEIKAYCIPVIADGCWLKRSYRTMYTSLSGYGVIIGYFTRKVLHVEVKNKIYAICNAARRKNEASRPHKCFRNWAGSSTSMECHAIAEGFQASLEKHQLVYNVLIADGDSSVYNRILACDPYKSVSIRVKKLECTNYLLRNFANKVRAIRNAGVLRKEVGNRILWMRTGITHAAKYRAKEDVSL